MNNSTTNQSKTAYSVPSTSGYIKVKQYDKAKPEKTVVQERASYLVSTKREAGNAVAIFDTKKESLRQSITEFNKRLGAR